VLDVGCGAGAFLRMLEVKGFRNLAGVDPFMPAEQSDARGPIRLRQGDVGVFAQEKFDLITMHHVVEHAPDPVALLNSAGQMLSRGGMILVRTPIVDSWASVTYGPNWVQHDAPRHLVILSSRGAEAAAAAAGLRILDSWRDEGRWAAWASTMLAAGRDPFRAPPWRIRIGGFRHARAAQRRNRRGEGDSACFVLGRALDSPAS